MKEVVYVIGQIGHVMRYRILLTYLWAERTWCHIFWDENKICKDCDKHLFAWYNGKYCWRHSRTHREHTVLVILGKSQK